jgi:hypothetical protein
MIAAAAAPEIKRIRASFFIASAFPKRGTFYPFPIFL